MTEQSAKMSGDSDKTDDEEETATPQKVSLTWKDYVALFIAALETVLLPMVMFVIVLFFVVLLVTGHL
jgi:hypothetical protein